MLGPACGISRMPWSAPRRAPRIATIAARGNLDRFPATCSLGTSAAPAEFSGEDDQHSIPGLVAEGQRALGWEWFWTLTHVDLPVSLRPDQHDHAC